MKRELIAQNNPKSPISEIFKTLRTNIQFMNSRTKFKSLLITSALPGEGKSWVASNLAVAFAQTGKKVVIVDVDMRKGVQHQNFGIVNDLGISNYLSGIGTVGEAIDYDIDVYIRNTQVENLQIISRGSVPPNPSEILSSEKSIDLLEELKKRFDIVIFDGTPSLMVTDALILSRLVDSTIIVTAYGRTKKEELKRVKKDFDNVGAKVVGVVFNKIPMNVKRYEKTYYYKQNDMPVVKKNSEFAKEKVIKEEKKSKLYDYSFLDNE